MFAFDQFIVDPLCFELRRDSLPVHVQRVPLDLLLLLLERRGTVVDRSTIEARLWGGGVHVDVEHGINTAIRKLRRTLGDDPARPRFIQTVVGQGYRFIAPVRQPSDRTPSVPNPGRPPAGLAGEVAGARPLGHHHRRTTVMALVAAAMAVAAVLVVTTHRPALPA